MSAEREIDEIKVSYVEAYEVGRAPSLESIVLRYPQYCDELVDFVTTLIEIDRALEWTPDPPEPSVSTRRLREQAVIHACQPQTLQEALAAAGVSRAQVAAAVNVTETFLLRVERGRLIAEGEELPDRRFVSRLANVLRRSTEEVLDILRVTFYSSPASRRVGHARGTSQPTLGNRPAPQPFRALLAGCSDLSDEQRREWFAEDAPELDKEQRQL